jgi:hypothetical protein
MDLVILINPLSLKLESFEPESFELESFELESFELEALPSFNLLVDQN